MTAPAIGANRARFFFSCIVSVLTKTVTVALMEGNTLEMSTHTHTHTHIQKRHRKPGDGLRGGGGVGKHNLSVKGLGFHCSASPKD